jgi:hypothetical protein
VHEGQALFGDIGNLELSASRNFVMTISCFQANWSLPMLQNKPDP